MIGINRLVWALIGLSLEIRIGNKLLPGDSSPKYLEFTLDRTLTNEKHIEKVAQKMKTKNSILKKLIGTS